MRLIDADELIPSLKMGEVNADTAYGDGRNGGIYFAIWRIGQMPTIDAVPVVRCKDCICFVSDMKWCEADDGHPTSPDKFCSWAERRSDE